jgi:hypothetical protein
MIHSGAEYSPYFELLRALDRQISVLVILETSKLEAQLNSILKFGLCVQEYATLSLQNFVLLGFVEIITL